MAARRRRVVWTERALSAVDEIAQFVAADDPSAADRLVEAFLQAAATRDTLTDRGRVVPEFGEETIREIFVYDFRLIYRVSQARVEVLTVVHGARDFRTWRTQR